MLNKNNPYLTFDNLDRFQNVYISDSDLHRNGISTDSARRLALVLGIDLRTVPPCFSTKHNNRAERKGSAITGQDVKTYFLRNGKGFTLEEMDSEYIQSKGYKNLVFNREKDHKKLVDNYKGLKFIFNDKQEGTIGEN